MTGAGMTGMNSGPVPGMVPGIFWRQRIEGAIRLALVLGAFPDFCGGAGC